MRADSAARNKRVALVGCGGWGKHILRDLVSLGCKLPVITCSAVSVRNAEEGGAERSVARVGDLQDADDLLGEVLRRRGCRSRRGRPRSSAAEGAWMVRRISELRELASQAA